MSSSAEVRIDWARRRRELREARIRGNVETFLARYESVVADLREQGLAPYVQEELDHAVTCIHLARQELSNDLEQAQAFSFEVGDLLRGLPAYARARRRGESSAARAATRAAGLREEVRAKRRELSEEAEKARGAAADALKALVVRLDAALSDRPAEGAEEQVREELRAVAHAADEVRCDEDLRRETLKALASTMRNLGFTLGESTYQGQWVRVQFRNLNGEKALFLVGASGAFKYAFHDYAGTACRKDRDRVRANLEEIYGIRFSDHRVIQENPDRIEKSTFEDARPRNGGGDGL